MRWFTAGYRQSSPQRFKHGKPHGLEPRSEKWGKLTADDLTAINGRREELEGKIQSATD